MRKKVDLTTGLMINIDLNASNSLLIVKLDPFKMEFRPRSLEKQWSKRPTRRRGLPFLDTQNRRDQDRLESYFTIWD
jgi:hypothetical protein